MVTLEDLTVIHAPIERCFDLARSVEVHLAGNVHSGESAKAIAGVTSGLVGLAERVTWRAKHFGVWHNLTSEITVMDRTMFRSGTERGSTPRRERPFRRIGQSYRRSHFRTRWPGRACYLAIALADS